MLSVLVARNKILMDLGDFTAVAVWHNGNISLLWKKLEVTSHCSRDL